MPDDYYPDTDAEEMPHRDEGGEDQAETALLPKTILQGKKFDVGEEVVFEIVHEYQDEIEVKYAPEKPKKERQTMPGGGGGPGPESMDMAGAQAQLGDMAT